MQVGFAQLSNQALEQSSGNLAVPSPTIGAVASVTAASKNSAFASMQVPSNLALSALGGMILAFWTML
jgi:hypothetical protein